MEVLDVVDENDKVVGSASVVDIYEKRLNHRIAHVLIFNDKGELLLQMRSAKKRFCPGHWVTSAGGHVKKGESYEEAAKRELLEEIGVDVPLTLIHESPYDHYKMRKFLKVFRGVCNGPFKFNADEVSGCRWFSVADVKDMVKKNQLVHPELSHIIERLYP
ncbi:NUDIX domain-containing protein [Candidatus Woesearchaeota archaeon]|nr:NUDIX domain-containing protein [Candidatus Woesearchaeota archaeon]MBW3016126.1 NUDIX domain-containing protein [Candidatus Woesearchaeota archaeon]